MLLKIKNLKFINNLKFTTVALLCLGNAAFAQEIIEEDVVAKVDSTTLVQNTKSDVPSNYKKQKVDAVAAVVGDFIVLESDVDKTYLQLEAQGVNVKDIEPCQLFGKLLEDKLYAHHAIQDSIIVSDAEIRSMVDYQMEQFLAELNGDMKRLLALYEKDTEKAVREEMFEINKKNKLAQEMQAKIVSEIEVTPEEVRLFFSKIPKEDRPTFGTELKVAQIVSEPKVSEEEEQRVIDRLKQFKADIIEKGASFRSKAVLYSEDPGSASRGGKYTLNKKKPRMVKEFRQVAFALQEGEISEPFKSDFGYHIITVDKIRGQEYDVSHILLTPKVSSEAIAEAKERLEKVRERIESGAITFADAAREASDEKETRNDGGQLINPATQDYNFELTKLDTELYSQIQDLKEGEVSLVLTEQDRTGNVKFKILRVTDRINEHEANYARDYLKIRELALDEKKIKAIEDWQTEKIEDTYIKIGSKYRDCDFSGNWLKK
ncbi:peptidylprolyl isomerase [Algibacter lectus]|uniref:Periplasmic chaperone for outer membrane proteins SurA n=1 Tax=Algibacter lectus TaxID=221126 RepID=A0A4R8MKQ7_9FLAO|nr:peptidylprolyl isomerase [Algibacter lectus]MDO7135622.1 peptidylprolyl isomerase [Algibacter lectus]MWW25051.1 peptidylprolyl isomerase [Algibacter lectus]TDY64535.1 periplasmic chaperone for outer membrane proteins SurA [Algibacter lectus]